MFEDIFEMDVVRSRRQAIGFYLFFVITIIIAAMIFGALIGLWFGEVNEIVTKIGVTIAILASSSLGFLVAKAKSIFNAKTVVMILLAGVFSFFGGVILGLIPVAYLTTLPAQGVRPLVDDDEELSEVSLSNNHTN